VTENNSKACVICKHDVISESSGHNILTCVIVLMGLSVELCLNPNLTVSSLYRFTFILIKINSGNYEMIK
jgi:hypothetical protein